MKKQIKYQLIPVVVAIAAMFSGSASADQTAVAFDTARFWSMGTGTGVYGWQFTALSELQVSALGLYDDPGVYDGGFSGNGLLEPHTIGIWDVSNNSNPLAASLIPSGTIAPLVSGFRYVNTSPVLLLAGHEYVIAATYSAQDWTTGDNNNPSFVLTISPDIDFGGYRSSGSSVLAFPDTYTPGLLYAFGPNFSYTVVPEPSTLALFALGATALLISTINLCFRSRPVRVSLEKSVEYEDDALANKSLQATRDGRSCCPTASGFTLVGPACLSSGR
jgi:hypothetical protein